MDGCHCERSIYRSLPHQYYTMRRRRRRMVMSQVRGIIRNVSETLVAIEEVGEEAVEAIRGVKMILARHHQLCRLLPRLVMCRA